MKKQEDGLWPYVMGEKEYPEEFIPDWFKIIRRWINKSEHNKKTNEKTKLIPKTKTKN